jgi:hypothetical protein
VYLEGKVKAWKGIHHFFDAVPLVVDREFVMLGDN